jgi:hypothetical protein
MQDDGDGDGKDEYHERHEQSRPAEKAASSRTRCLGCLTRLIVRHTAPVIICAAGTLTSRDRLGPR